VNPENLKTFIKNNTELSLHRDYLHQLIRPSVDIVISLDKPKDHDSRFGGMPLVSNDFVWPLHPVGEYQFLGQINFSDINNIPEALPKTGMLSLFYAFDEDGEIFWGDDGYVLGYYWPEIDKLSIFKTTNNDSIHSSTVSRKILLNGGIEIPRHEDLRKDWPFSVEALDDLPEIEGYSEDYMLGYPSYCTLAYDPTPGENWTSLLTLTSCDELDWCWHDGDKLMIFIEKEKLRNKDFSHLKTDAG